MRFHKIGRTTMSVKQVNFETWRARLSNCRSGVLARDHTFFLASSATAESYHPLRTREMSVSRKINVT
jgi:hypothetical protein